MRRRPIGTTTVKQNMVCADKPSGVRTSVPGCSFLILGVEKPECVKWERVGRAYRIVPCGHEDGAVSVYISKGNHRITIPRDVAASMGVRADMELTWFVAVSPTSWEIHVEARN
ncbi:MAG: hypothetical protein MPK62_06340 [Alphaproteobacteria bacterium]|nr:hypothetical protein [Alphaproteobacteria bacterium]